MLPVRLEGDRYVNEHLGLTLVKPGNWHFLSVVDFQAGARRQQLAADGPERGLLRDPDASPFLVVTKFSRDHSGCNPCITCWDEIDDTNLDADIERHELALEAFTSFLRGVRVITPPAPLTLACGTLATVSAWRFLFQQDTGLNEATIVTTILVRRNDRLQTFHFMDRIDDGVAGAELKAAAQSISYVQRAV